MTRNVPQTSACIEQLVVLRLQHVYVYMYAIEILIQIQNLDSLLMNPAQSDEYRLSQFQFFNRKIFGTEIWGSLFVLSPDEDFSPIFGWHHRYRCPSLRLSPQTLPPKYLIQRLSTHCVIWIDPPGNFLTPFCSCCSMSWILFLTGFLFHEASMHFSWPDQVTEITPSYQLIISHQDNCHNFNNQRISQSLMCLYVFFFLPLNTFGDSIWRFFLKLSLFLLPYFDPIFKYRFLFLTAIAFFTFFFVFMWLIPALISQRKHR